jgi:hypothetical protein
VKLAPVATVVIEAGWVVMVGAMSASVETLIEAVLAETLPAAS